MRIFALLAVITVLLALASAQDTQYLKVRLNTDFNIMNANVTHLLSLPPTALKAVFDDLHGHIEGIRALKFARNSATSSEFLLDVDLHAGHTLDELATALDESIEGMVDIVSASWKDTTHSTFAGAEASSQTYAAHCSNGKQDRSETDIDCGGACPVCLVGKQCRTSADCISDICTPAGVCASIPNPFDPQKDSAMHLTVGIAFVITTFALFF